MTDVPWLALLLLPAAAAAQPQTPNLPGAEPEARASGFAEQNRRAAAARAAFERDRAAYEAELAANAEAQRRAQTAQAAYRERVSTIATNLQPAAERQVAPAAGPATTNDPKRCRVTQGATLTGSHVARLGPRRTC